MFKATVETAVKMEQKDFTTALQAKEWVQTKMADIGQMLHGRVMSEERRGCLLWCRVHHEAFGFSYETVDGE